MTTPFPPAAVSPAGSEHDREGNGAGSPAPSAGRLAADGAVRAMLEARSVALVGASPRPASFGRRMLEEAGRGSARPRLYPVNPRYREIDGARCYPSLRDLPEACDLALLAVPDAALEQQLTSAAERGCRSAVIFGNAHADTQPVDTAPPLRERLAGIARAAGMAVCGAGCMGFVNVGHGLRALGYTEPDPVPPGPVALVTHSGSAFSALLRARRGYGYTLAVSSGQELVTAAPAYLDYALDQPGTGVLALVLEAIRDGLGLRRVLARAAEADVPVVLLTVGGSAAGATMVAAHSGALAGSDGGWEALARAYGVHWVGDLAEFTDTIELLAIGRRIRAAAPADCGAPPPGRLPEATVREIARCGLDSQPESVRVPGREPQPVRVPASEPQPVRVPASEPQPVRVPASEPQPVRVPARGGIATVHDSGLERAHVADVAESVGVPFAEISAATTARLAALLDPGLVPANPLDVWGTGADTRGLFAGSLLALADDPAVEAVALAVDLVHELDGDDAYLHAVLDAAQQTDKPLAVLANLPSAIDQDWAAQLRAHGVPVLEGTRSGLRALGHLRDQVEFMVADLVGSEHHQIHNHDGRSGLDTARRSRGRALFEAGEASGAHVLDLLAEYGISVARTLAVDDLEGALAAADAIGYPVVLKTGQPEIAHKSDVGGVVLGIGDAARLEAAYRDLSVRLGPRVLVCQAVPPGVELALGIVSEPELGPLVVVGAGGVLVELLADRAVALPPVSAGQGRRLLDGLRVRALLAGARGAPPADLDTVARAIAGVSALAMDLGDQIDALDVNPLVCGPDGAVAVDALLVPRRAG